MIISTQQKPKFSMGLSDHFFSIQKGTLAIHIPKLPFGFPMYLPLSPAIQVFQMPATVAFLYCVHTPLQLLLKLDAVLYAPHNHTSDYRKTSNISRTLAGNKIVDKSDVVGASPVGAAPTTSSFSTLDMASMDWAKTTARGYKKHLSFGIWCNLYKIIYGSVSCKGYDNNFSLDICFSWSLFDRHSQTNCRIDLRHWSY